VNGKEGLLSLANIPELKRRLFYLFLGLAIYRFAVHIPAPGVNSEAFFELFQRAGGTLFWIFGHFFWWCSSEVFSMRSWGYALH